MAGTVKLIGYLPEILQDIRDLQELTAAEDPEFGGDSKITGVFEQIDIEVNNCFIDTLDSYGCARWESMLAITAKDTDTLDLRRMRIKAALNGDTPYTMRSLENKLKALCGEGNYVVSYANDAYTLSVDIALRAKDQYEYIKNLLYEIVPANIIITVKLLYNTHILLRKYKHSELAQYTHKQIREEVLP